MTFYNRNTITTEKVHKSFQARCYPEQSVLGKFCASLFTRLGTICRSTPTARNFVHRNNMKQMIGKQTYYIVPFRPLANDNPSKKCFGTVSIVMLKPV